MNRLESFSLGPMLHEFLTAHRLELIERCRARSSVRQTPLKARAELESGIPLFIDQLVATLRAEQVGGPEIPASAPRYSPVAMGATAQRHGRSLLRQGFTIDQVVHDYGDLCQEVTGMAMERDAAISIDEFRVLNRCLDEGIAQAVTEFSYLHDSQIADSGAHALNERLGFLAHELRNHLNTATLAVLAMKGGGVGLSGATAAVLDRSLVGMRILVDRSLADVRLAAGLAARHALFAVADFIAEVQVCAMLEANLRHCTLRVSEVDAGLAVDGDRDLLFSALGNLLQNAFKFTRPGTEVHLHVHAAADRIIFCVEDRCGGLPEGDVESIFVPFVQQGRDKSGLGLGLAISRRGVEANHGTLRAEDLPGTGCVFIIDLPRQVWPGAA